MNPATSSTFPALLSCAIQLAALLLVFGTVSESLADREKVANRSINLKRHQRQRII